MCSCLISGSDRLLGTQLHTRQVQRVPIACWWSSSAAYTRTCSMGPSPTWLWVVTAPPTVVQRASHLAANLII